MVTVCRPQGQGRKHRGQVFPFALGWLCRKWSSAICWGFFFLVLSAHFEKYLSNKSYQTAMTRKTLGLTRKPNKDAKPVTKEAEAMVEVEGEEKPGQIYFVNPRPYDFIKAWKVPR
jgi:hypothetical protein